jgi:hypothetical protein
VTTRPALIVPAVTVGIVLLVLAVLYFVDSAGSLPGFMPGHQTGSAQHHVKHGIAALLLGLGCLFHAWFQTGSAAARTRSEASGVDWAADGTVD